MVYFKKFFLFILFIILFSCEKNENIINYVIAGISSTNGIYLYFDPPLKPDLKLSGCLEYTGKFNLNLNNDTIAEFKFCSFKQELDYYGICNNNQPLQDSNVLTDYWPSGRIYNYIIINDTSYQIACDNGGNTVCFSFNDTINNNFKWKNKERLTLNDIVDFGNNTKLYGNWNLKNTGYIGIRRIDIDTIYGWIKININEIPEIWEIYLNKYH